MDVDELLFGMLSKLIPLNNIGATNIALDSRNISVGSLFLFLEKEKERRLSYLIQAIENGAVAVAHDSMQPLLYKEKIACYQQAVSTYSIDNLQYIIGDIAAKFYRHPSDNLTIIGITGTNGKTSVSHFIAQALEFLYIPCGVVGTLGVGRVNELIFNGMTTPNPVILQSTFANFIKQDISHVVIESSSHALDQGRLNGVHMDIGVLTNMSRDHLDYHRRMANYVAAKQSLFHLRSVQYAIINTNDSFGKILATKLNCTDAQLLTYSSNTSLQHNTSLHVQAIDIMVRPAGISFKLQSKFETIEIKTSLIGVVNVDNLLAAIQVLLAIGIPFKDASEAISHCYSIRGRMEIYGGDDQVYVAIDFAHTPDALSRAIIYLRMNLSTQGGKLWCIFGCGGDRDKKKRALMGSSAENNADQLVITTDNPRSESNDAIVEDILVGIRDINSIYIEHDRQQAINYAINAASITDIILVAGKGDEKYQEIGGIKYPFSDAQVVTKALMLSN